MTPPKNLPARLRELRSMHLLVVEDDRFAREQLHILLSRFCARLTTAAYGREGLDAFTYDHSERLGDAFEYLLSVLGSQGDAGQFRTPRHIIDFMVEVIDPQKHESILDPACGTAGFLISAWKHILKQNTKERPGDQLTPDERANLAANIHGYCKTACKTFQISGVISVQ